MRKLVSLLVASCALVGLASGCAVDAALDDQEASGSDHLALVNCSNPQGTNAMIAAVAVAIANDLGRWKVGTDFTKVTGAYNQQHLALSSTGLAQCAARGNACENVKALLFFQDARYDNYIRFPGNVKLSAWSYAARLVAGYDAQKVCESRATQNPSSADACPAEDHVLTLTGTSPGACDMNFTYDARTPTGGMLRWPHLLKNKLVWANDGGSFTNLNPYIAFQSTAGTVTIDPTFDLNQPGSASGGSCIVACQKYDRSNLTGQCCTCNGQSGTFFQSPAANTYKCSAGG
jgi:hypothetical protein